MSKIKIDLGLDRNKSEEKEAQIITVSAKPSKSTAVKKNKGLAR
ncbi:MULTISPECIES: hypothetical protein [Bacillus]|nr:MULTISPECIES: hypothetical protein [Bacillus]MEC1050945.1 hypothetical protein [Bacillus paralicheniformis]MEC1085024.1 hypothetical protein [Bacillus paralicheniformis]MEC1108822.1 hypothetical protein [Bacillus paralicheniformis]MEC1137200.1 hypothetical protein [Bacillus paralicheniformis]MEC1148047.1 hypothetical protein [Bacillus paralicheniformis]